MNEYRVTWRRLDQAQKHALYQTLAGAEACKKRQMTAQSEMDWVTVAPIVFGPIIEIRKVGPWSPLSGTP